MPVRRTLVARQISLGQRPPCARARLARPSLNAHLLAGGCGVVASRALLAPTVRGLLTELNYARVSGR
jgi:hypothetical protein